MRAPFRQKVHTELRLILRVGACVLVAGMGSVRGEDAAGGWQVEINPAVSQAAGTVRAHSEPPPAVKNRPAKWAGRDRGLKASGNREGAPSSRHRLVRDIETGSVDGVNAVPSHAPNPTAAAVSPVAASPIDMTSTTGRFCVNIKPQLEEMRIAFQKKSLAEVEVELERRLKLLEDKITEYKQWFQRRQDFSNKAQDALVKIYTKMRPDAAAQQLSSAETETAAAVLLKLDPRVASAILNDMDPKLAATLAAVIAGASQTNDETVKPTGGVP